MCVQRKRVILLLNGKIGIIKSLNEVIPASIALDYGIRITTVPKMKSFNRSVKSHKTMEESLDTPLYICRLLKENL